MKQKKGNRKKKDTRPARDRYWRKETLLHRKVRRLMRAGLSESEATMAWLDARRGRHRLTRLSTLKAGKKEVS